MNNALNEARSGIFMLFIYIGERCVCVCMLFFALPFNFFSSFSIACRTESVRTTLCCNSLSIFFVLNFFFHSQLIFGERERKKIAIFPRLVDSFPWQNVSYLNVYHLFPHCLDSPTITVNVSEIEIEEKKERRYIIFSVIK